ncbi:protein-tyrosine phosphatase-like protein [Leucosporidium creatinivorum]|uniref:protein-tyrosine-phosphatase n=1 Tax=Leucosporidium creatinivorum TaxID=106004 RepID=A0A1Y2ETL4_9BASI|nr:protein-tyrosine phosphatase-like protein [Leucosporidium creatinivorum]
MSATHSRSSSLDPDGDSILTDSELAAPPSPQRRPLSSATRQPLKLSYSLRAQSARFWALNAACLYRFCLHVHTLLEDSALKSKRIFLYSSDEPDKKANAALLMALYAMIVMRWSPADVLHPIACLELQPFRDAGYARADFHLSLQSCIYGIHRAIALHLLDLSTFDLVAYETYEKVENGDWNWLTPGFVAFASPVEPSYVAALNGGGAGRRPEGSRPRLSKAFENVLQEFETGGVKVVIRLNKKLYDAQHFTERGMDHIEMYFDDGTNPPMEMTREFIDIADRTISAGGAVAVHCKAGLGRTGTLIGAYLIYKHGFSADEAIGFMRLMRPGSCVGPQQHYLYENQMTWVRWAAMDAIKAEQRLLTLASQTAEADRQRLATTTPPLQTPKAPKRPITPPNEETLARSRQVTPGASATVPRTPGRSVMVPGQPRKTPGKSKHSVASPEVQHALDAAAEEEEEEVEGEEGVTLKDELMLVAAAEENEAEEGEHLPSHSSPARPPPPPQPRLAPPPPSNTTKRAPTPTSTRPTRIARARQRPLSAIADNRIVDRLGLHTDRTLPPNSSSSSTSTSTAATTRASTRAGAPTRSKAVKDLGTLFESGAGDAMDVSTNGAAGGYNLRGGRTSPPQGLQPAAQLQPPASPSKLPQRVPAKRRGGVKEKEVQPTAMTFGAAGGAGAGRRERSVTAGGRGAAAAAGGLGEVERTIKAVGLSRNVRRRSSLGSEDFVQG